MKRKDNMPDMPPMPPDKDFCGGHEPNPTMIINEISRLFNARMREREETGIMSQMSAKLILSALSHKDGLNQLELVRITSLKAPTISLTLAKMEQEGLVRREADPNDGRACRIFISEAGREHERAVFAAIKEIEAIIMSGVSDEDYATLMRILTGMRDNILSDYLKTNKKQK